MTRHWFVLILFLAWAPFSLAAAIDKSDLNGDGFVDDPRVQHSESEVFP
jgi:hypothetical protein